MFDALLESFAEAEEALALGPRAAPGRATSPTPREDDRYDDAYYSQLYEREGPRLRARLSRAAERVGSLWLSAWEEAGRPTLDASFRLPYVRRQTRLIVASLDGAAAPVVARRGGPGRDAASRARCENGAPPPRAP